MKSFAKSLLILFGALFLSILMNASVLMTTYEYSDESQRGKSELTINPDGSKKTGETSGVAREEITRWSYGVLKALIYLFLELWVVHQQKIWVKVQIFTKLN